MEPVLTISSEDRGLAQRILAGDGAAEADLVRRFEPGLRAIARVRVGPDHAADLVQETLAIALVNLRRGAWRGDGCLAAYLATILRRGALHLRDDPAAPSPADLDDVPSRTIDPLARAEGSEVRRRLASAVADLAPGHREVLLRHYFEDASAERISRDLGIPRGTVLSRLYHARRKVAAALNRGRRRGHTATRDPG